MARHVPKWCSLHLEVLFALPHHTFGRHLHHCRGQQGINIIPTETPQSSVAGARAVFSGLTLFDHPIATGEKFGGHIVLERSLNASRHLRLRHNENAFNILLASDHATLPQRARFLYCLDGFADGQWLMLPDGQSAVTFTNLSPGSYTLRVKVVGRDGSVSQTESALRITVLPPWWLTPWAYALHALLLCATVWLVWYFTVHRKLERLKLLHLRHMDEMKLKFLTNISHELRTPLALIISPLRVMIDKEADAERLSRLQLIYRNAQRLLSKIGILIPCLGISIPCLGIFPEQGDVFGGIWRRGFPNLALYSFTLPHHRNSASISSFSS